MTPFIWVVLLMTALSGFFATASYCLRTFRRVLLESAFKGPHGKRRMETLERHLPALRLVSSLCRSVSNLILVVVLVYMFGRDGHNWISAAWATILAAAIISIFGVAIAHAWASYAGEKFLAATLGVLMFFRYALYPVIAAMQVFDIPIRRLAGAEDEEHENGDTAKQEILQVASEGQAEGAVDAEEVEMIESVIEFGQTHADEIMTPRTELFALPVDTDWDTARRKVVQAGHTRVPLYEDDLDSIVGILYAKDLLNDVDNSQKQTLRGIMRKCYFVPETKLLDDLLRDFKARKVHMAVVLDEYGGTAGVVTIEDVLEEIVGEIADEYDRAEPAMINRIDARVAEVDGRVMIDDLNELLELDIPEDEDYDTVAGFVFSELGYIPTVGETFQANGAQITVEAADERKITKLRVERLEKDEDTDRD